jgi:hypothetical protein
MNPVSSASGNVTQILNAIQQGDPHAAALVKLRFFAGVEHQEAAEMLGLGRRRRLPSEPRPRRAGHITRSASRDMCPHKLPPVPTEP